MADHFLTKSKVDLGECLSFGDRLALDLYPAMHAFLQSKAGPETARLFAEPLVSRGNDTAAPSVSWYTDVEGTGEPLDRLDDEMRADVEARLSRQLAPLSDLMNDPDGGGLLAAAMNVRSPEDIWVVDGKPVILNWAMLPGDVGRDGASRLRHYQGTLGRFLPLGSAPPLTAAEREDRSAQAARVAPVAAAAAVGGAAAGAAGMAAADAMSESETTAAGSVPPPPPPNQTVERRVPRGAWIPLVLLLLLAAGTLAWLLIPGNRILADRTEPVVQDAEALRAAEEVNKALKERLASLQSALDGAQCKADGTLLMPDGFTIEGLLPPDPRDPLDRPGAIRQADATPVLPPAAERVTVPAPEGGTAALVDMIDRRTALVIGNAGTGLATGTGFFVGPDLIVTNFHVIEGVPAGELFVTNEDLASLRVASVLKTMGPVDKTGGDFALLRVEGVNQPSFTVLDTDASLRLQSVVAAGYPGDLLASDDQFRALRAGDRSAVPALALTDGTITTEQKLSATTDVVVHSAPISKGNSGGPLIDMCGRLVGVNTFVVEGALRNLNFALSGKDLMRFLEGTAALPNVVGSACEPQVQRPTVPGLQAAIQPKAQEALPVITPLQPKTDGN